VVIVAAGCMAVTACSFLAVYTCITAFTEQTWPEF
jgi:hypothetical protein